MERWQRGYDEWKTTPPEPDIVGECACCEADLYAGCDYVHDTYENEWYCDEECFLENRRASGGLVRNLYEAPERDER